VVLIELSRPDERDEPDGRRDEDGTGRAAVQGAGEWRCRFPARGGPGAERGADGAGGDPARRGGAARADGGADGAAERVPRAGVGHAGGDAGAAGAEGPGRELLPEPARPAEAGRAGAGGGGAGGVRPGGVDPAGGRAGAGARDGRHLEEPSQPAVRDAGRRGGAVPDPAAGRAIPVRLAGRDVPEGARAGACGIPGSRDRRGGPVDRRARGAGPGRGAERGRRLLAPVPAIPGGPWPTRG
jgi:hypothetical protein